MEHDPRTSSRSVPPIPHDNIVRIFGDKPNLFEAWAESLQAEAANDDEVVYEWLREVRTVWSRRVTRFCYVVGLASALYFAAQLGRGAF